MAVCVLTDSANRSGGGGHHRGGGGYIAVPSPKSGL
nr:MAG TPA: CtsR-like protein [Caudoviricetes sp.]